MIYQFDIIVRNQKSRRIITTDCYWILEPALGFTDIWNKIRTRHDIGAKKQLSLKAFYLFKKRGTCFMPWEGNVDAVMYKGRALKAWLEILFSKLETYAYDYEQLEIDLRTPYRWIDVYITPIKEK